jgi:2-desacetyl-2-hydroxyethyl bacteriochlorophyllide A dehydrogenase
MSEENTTREFWVQEPGRGEIITGRLNAVGPSDVVVRNLYSGISRGTESLVFRGEVPASRYREMRAPFQAGDFPAPVKYGYISVGLVESAGDDATDLIDRVVFCLHPHQDRYVVPASAVTVLPESVPAPRAVLAANMETAVNAVWDAEISIGDRVLVVGAGVVGLLIAWLAARIPGTNVTIVDIREGRADVATGLGVHFDTAAPPAMDADVVVHASGNPEGLTTALASAGTEARVVEVSWFGDRLVAVPLGEAFHDRRLSIRSSQVGRIPPGRAPRWDFARRLAVALDLLECDALDALITGESEFDELPDVMERLAGSGGDTLCHRIRYD